MTDKQYAENIQAVMDKLFPNIGSNARLYKELQKAVLETDFETERQSKIWDLFDKLEGALIDFEEEVKFALKSESRVIGDDYEAVDKANNIDIAESMAH